MYEASLILHLWRNCYELRNPRCKLQKLTCKSVSSMKILKELVFVFHGKHKLTHLDLGSNNLGITVSMTIFRTLSTQPATSSIFGWNLVASPLEFVISSLRNSARTQVWASSAWGTIICLMLSWKDCGGPSRHPTVPWRSCHWRNANCQWPTVRTWPCFSPAPRKLLTCTWELISSKMLV